jgi:hypothetical protein
MVADQTKKMMEISWEYKQGLRNLEQAVTKMMGVTGLDRDLSESFLRGLNRDNIMRVDFSKKTRNGRETRRTVGAGPKID